MLKALAVVPLITTLFVISCCWFQGSPGSRIKERSSFYHQQLNRITTARNSTLKASLISKSSQRSSLFDTVAPVASKTLGKSPLLSQQEHQLLTGSHGSKTVGNTSSHHEHFPAERRQLSKEESPLQKSSLPVEGKPLAKDQPRIRGRRKKKKLKKKGLQPESVFPAEGKKGVHSIHQAPPEVGKGKKISHGTGKKYSKLQAKHNLSPEVINGIQKFVLFVGYARSGSSIVGTLMDAHPHVVISNEFNIFDQFSEIDIAPSFSWRENLYNLLYSRSTRDAKWSRSSLNKGYQLRVGGLWQGRFDRYIEVIGDKSSDVTTRAFLKDSEEFLRNYQKLKSEVSVPLRIIHTLRNPFDIISTDVVINNVKDSTFRQLKETYISNSTQLGRRSETVRKYGNTAVLKGNIPLFFKRINATLKLIEIFGRENVLDVHSCDLVADPRGTVSKIFEFLGVYATQQYLEACARKVFKTSSRSRNMVGWTPELIEVVERGMKNYDVLGRYSFNSD